MYVMRGGAVSVRPLRGGKLRAELTLDDVLLGLLHDLDVGHHHEESVGQIAEDEKSRRGEDGLRREEELVSDRARGRTSLGSKFGKTLRACRWFVKAVGLTERCLPIQLAGAQSAGALAK
jgi:hypothetical protein